MRIPLLIAALVLAGAAARAQVVTIGTGTSVSALTPINHAEAYSVSELIYLQTQINQAGSITRLAFDKNSGTNLTPLNNVFIYLKATSASTVTATAPDSTGYQRVYKGSFPNAATAGWQEVQLTQPFAYNNVDNLSVLVVRLNGSTDNVLASRARWNYTSGSRVSVRRGYDAIYPTTFTTSTFLPNIRLTFGTTTAAHERQVAVGGLYPNPATNQLFVAAEGPTQVRITDLRGRELRPAAVLSPVGGRLTLSVAELPAGVYVLQQRRANGTAVAQRFVRE